MRTKDDVHTVGRGRKTFIFAVFLALFAVFSVTFCACDDIENKILSVNYTITFVLNNGEQDVVWNADTDACPLDMVDGVPTPKNGDKVFGGWYCDKTLETPFEFDFENIFLADSFTIYAKWLEKNNFEGLVFEDTIITYDGNPHTIVVSNLPEGATVTYVGEIQFVNVGEYEIEAVVKKDGYNDMSLTATLTINKAKIEGVTFEDKTVEWDGEAHSIEVSGLPKGVKVEYTNNSQSAVGVYEVCASFEVGDNYLPLEDMSATLTILQKFCKVTFVVGDKQTVVDIPYGNTIANRPTIDEKDGYQASWNVDVSTEIRDDMTISAVYVPIEYKIEFDLCGGEGEIESITYTIESEDIILDSISRKGYEFCGWYQNSNYLGNAVERIEHGSFGNVKLYAKWKPIEYSITYILNVDGALNAESNPQSYTVESDIITLSAPSVLGHIFVGWYSDEQFENKVDCIDPSSLDGDITLYARWEKEEYNITYILKGGVNDSRNPATYVYHEDCALFAPTREHYDFLGWFIEDGRNVENLIDSMGDVVLTAEWSPTVYHINYDLADGVNDDRNKLSYTIEDNNFSLYPATRAHYEFVGWQDGGMDITAIDTSRACDINLTAVWADVWYDIQYVLDGGTLEGEVESRYTYFMLVTLPIPKKENCEFLGWYDNPTYEGNAVDCIPIGSEGNKVFYAKFETNNVQFTYELRKQNEYGEQITPYYAITKYIGKEQIVSVPSVIDGHEIKTISASTFSGSAVTEIVIEEGIVELEDGVFDGLDSLKTLKLPTSISYIPNGILKDCTSLSHIVLPYVGDRIYKSTDKDRNLFGFSQLFEKSASASIQDGFVCVPNYSLFADEVGSIRATEEGTYALIPSSLKNVTVLGGDIFNYAFAYCDNIEVLRLMGGEYIADFAIRECKSLKTLAIDDTFANISTNSLYSSQNIQEIIVGSETQRTFFEELKGRGKIGASVVITLSTTSSTSSISTSNSISNITSSTPTSIPQTSISTPQISTNTSNSVVTAIQFSTSKSNFKQFSTPIIISKTLNTISINMYIYTNVEEVAK